MTARRLLPTFLLVLLLALAGCGGDDSDSDSGSGGDGGGEDATAVYDKAISGLDDVKSGKLDARVDTVLELGSRQEINVSEKATFSDGGGTTLPKFDVQINVEQTGGQPQETSAIYTGDDFFVKQQGATEYQAQGPKAAESVADTYTREQGELGEGRLPLLSLTPSDWAKSPKIEGTEDVGGVKVQRIVAELDVPAFLKDLETGKNSDIGMGVSLTKNARELMEPDADVDKKELVALVGEEDGKLYRLTAGVDGNVAGGVKVDFNVDLTGLDEPQEITAPGASGE